MATTSATPVPVQDLKEWHTPSSRTEVIHELIHGVDRYNPSNLSFMEEYLLQQVQSGEYDLLANLAILKLYQFNPQLSNPDVILNILIKSLSATVHGPDFNLCLMLLRDPAAILADIDSEDDTFLQTMPFLQQLHDLVRTCQFTKFWALYRGTDSTATAGANEAGEILRSNAAYFPSHKGLEERFQSEFAAAIAASFRNVKVKQLQRWLDLKDGEVEGWTSSHGWKVNGESVEIPPNGDNDVKAGVVKEKVELSQLTKLVSAAAF